MKQSLKTKLHETIQKEGSITLYQLEQLCHTWQYKLATAERQLRPSQSPEVESIWKNHAIVGYKWRGTDKQQLSNVKRFLEEWPSHRESIIKEPSVLF